MSTEDLKTSSEASASKKVTTKKPAKTTSNKQWIGNSVLCLATLLLLQYCLLQYHDQLLVVLIASAIFLATAYLVLKSLANRFAKPVQVDKEPSQKELAMEQSITEYMETTTKLAKANYVTIKKQADTMDALMLQLAEAQQANQLLLEQLSDEYKKSAKGIIKYNHDNTVQIISSLNENAKAITEMISQEQESLSASIEKSLSNVLSSSNKSTQDEMHELTRALELNLTSITHELDQISSSIRSIPATSAIPVMASMPQETLTPTAKEEITDIPEEPALAETEFISAEDLDQDYIDSLLGFTSEPASDSDTITELPIGEANGTEDILSEDIPDVPISLAEESEESEEEPKEESKEATVSMPDPSDPNKQLSPDEIAALFANADSIVASANDEPEGESEPEPEPEPEPFVEPVVEEKPPMPDLSGDSNKQLSPDEIAALFAALG